MSWLYTIIFSGLLFSGGVTGSNQRTEVPPTIPATGAIVDVTDRFEQTYPLSSDGRVSVSNVNGSITAKAWDRNEVKLVAVKTGDSKESIDGVKIAIDSTGDQFRVAAKYDEWRENGRNWNKGSMVKVDFDLMVPRGAVLDSIETVNGSVTVSDFQNTSRVSAVNGDVKATDLRGNVELETVNGQVYATFSQLDASNRIQASTVNGSVKVIIPSDSNAILKADTVNGSISNDFGLPVSKGKYVGSNMSGRLGSGGVPIHLESVNGNLNVSHAADGRQLSPSVNMLKQKGGDDDDEDWDSQFDKDMQRTVAKAQARSAKAAMVISKRTAIANAAAAVQAQKIAQETLVNIQPMIANIDPSAQIRSAIESINIATPRIPVTVIDTRAFPMSPRIVRKTNSFKVNAPTRLVIDAPACSVRVIGTDSSEIRYSLTDVGTSSSASAVKVEENVDPGQVKLEVRGIDDGAHWPTVLEVYVPKKTDLEVTTDREIRIDGVSGTLKVTGSDASINMHDIDGSLSVTSDGGRIRLIGFKGAVDARSDTGLISLDGDFSSLSAVSDAGDVVVTLPAGTGANVVATGLTNFEGLDARSTSSDPDGDGPAGYMIGKGGAKFSVHTDGMVLFRATDLLAVND